MKKQTPVRNCFGRGGKRQGFFGLDTVSRCGANASGRFCQVAHPEQYQVHQKPPLS
ncbi:MAG: hypothetical protein LBH43_11315 [Treponema sp.]|nr:hypothetical protein [Treponema sp.]